MADTKDKFADIQEMLTFLRDESKKIDTALMIDYKKMRLDAEQEFADTEKRNKE